MQPPSLPNTAPSSGFSTRLGLTWIAIVCTVIGAMWLQRERQEPAPDDGTQPALTEVAPVGLESEMSAKMVVAMNGLRAMSPMLRPADILRNAEPLRESNEFAERLGYAVLVGKIESWEAGVESAKALEPATDSERALRDAAVSVLEERAFGHMSGAETGHDRFVADDEEIAVVREKLGFFGRVACDDAAVGDEAMRAGAVLMVAVAWYGIVFCAGLVVLIFALIKLMKPAPAAGVSPDEPSRQRVALILGETFAVWMVAFFGTNMIGAWIGSNLVSTLGLADTPRGVHLSLLVGALAFFSSLAALAYPVLRGISPAQLREALGLHCGRGIAREALQGVACYLSAVPLLVAGLIVFFLLTLAARAIFGEAAEPGHPVTELYADADAMRIALVFLLASVIAPIVEEIMFRGALFGHLRATVAPRTRILSFAIAAIVSSAIFALIHPQGVLFAPALGGLAVGFCLYRETRGSLVAPMVAHGINNAVTLALGMSLMS
ncbi:MAG: hypothetical protein RLY21_881 [Planctomycetota bacterium]|jgi:membrane protease YdiL (CAAX protease family)